MKPYISVALSCLAFLMVWALPCYYETEDNRYHHSVVDILSNERVLYIDGLTRINHRTITHIASLQDESMPTPIILGFKGTSHPYVGADIFISGKMNLLSIQEIRSVINNAFLSPYLVLNDDLIHFKFELIQQSEVFSLIRDTNTGRTKLVAKR